jgi:nucleotide-binding universal stress UspA family protein
MKPRRILVPIDFSPASRAALERAAEWAEMFGAEIDVVHAIESLDCLPERVELDLPGLGRVPLSEAMGRRASEALDAFLADAKHAAARVRARRIKMGLPSSTIVELADREGYDLIVMGTHGRRGVERLLLGSVAARVLRHAPCPVLTVTGSDG